MTDDPIDRHLDHLRRVAEEAAASVQPLDLERHEAALVAEAAAELARQRAADPPQGIDWERIRRLALRHQRPWTPQ